MYATTATIQRLTGKPVRLRKLVCANVVVRSTVPRYVDLWELTRCVNLYAGQEAAVYSPLTFCGGRFTTAEGGVASADDDTDAIHVTVYRQGLYIAYIPGHMRLRVKCIKRRIEALLRLFAETGRASSEVRSMFDDYRNNRLPAIDPTREPERHHDLQVYYRLNHVRNAFFARLGIRQKSSPSNSAK